jgi:F-type H+-transporting ATPase subunit a
MDRIFPDVVFTLFGLPVRNSVTATWAMMVMIVAAVLYLRSKAPVVLEMLVDFTEGLTSSFIQNSTSPYIPFLGSLFLFVVIANLIGVVPLMFTPTRDINTPIALALVVLAAVFAFTIRAKGFLGFLKTFLSATVPLDLIGYVSRTTSLALRLFGNVIGGEMIVAVLFSLVPVGIPLIMVALTSITGILQAYVFTALAASYINMNLEN